MQTKFKIFSIALILASAGWIYADIAVTPGTGKTVATTSDGGREFQNVTIATMSVNNSAGIPTNVGYASGNTSIPISITSGSISNTGFNATQSGVFQVEPGSNTFKASIINTVPVYCSTFFQTNQPVLVVGTPTVTFNGTQNVNVVNNSTASVTGSTVAVFNAVVAPVTGSIITATTIIASTFTPVYNNAAFTIWPGTATGVAVAFEGSFDSGSSWQGINATQNNNNQQGTAFTVATATTTWDANIAGMTNFRIRATGWTTGFSSVTIAVTGLPTIPSTNVTGSTVSLNPITITAITTGTFSGTGYPIVGVATSLKVTSTTLPSATNDGNSVAQMGTNIGQQVVAAIPWGIIQTDLFHHDIQLSSRNGQ